MSWPLYCSKNSQATEAMRWQAASLAAGSSAVRSTLYVSKFTPPSNAIVAREEKKDKEGETMSEKEKEMREMVETLRKLPDHAQEKIGYMIEGAALVSGAHEEEPKKDGGAA